MTLSPADAGEMDGRLKGGHDGQVLKQTRLRCRHGRGVFHPLD